MKQFSLKALGLLLSLLSSLTLAAGFRCDTPRGQLRIQVYQHTFHNTGGTRAAAIMILSNPTAPRGSRTIATMSSDQGLLNLTSGTFTGLMDLRFNSISQKPQTKVGPYAKEQIQQISITPDFRYSNPVPSNQQLSALFELTLRDGEVIKGTIQCRRYLKGPQKASKTCAEQLELDF